MSQDGAADKAESLGSLPDFTEEVFRRLGSSAVPPRASNTALAALSA
jgi:hypothetical protein